MTDHLSKQRQLQHTIDKALDNFKKVGKANLTPARVRSRMASLKDVWNKFFDGHLMVTKTIPEANRATLDYFTEETFDATEEAYQQTLDFMTEFLEDLEPPVSPHNSTTVSNFRATPPEFSVKHLPPMNLPPFNGDVKQWEPFRDNFISLIIDNRELSDFSRLHYLTSSLTGRAKDVIRHLDVTAENFDSAWRALVSRYESKRRLLNTHLSAIFNLTPVLRESASDICELRDKIKSAVTSLGKLRRTPEQLWDDVLVHTIVPKLDSNSRKLWSGSMSRNDEPPSFETLIEFMDSRVRAIEDFNTSSASKSTSTRSVSQKINASTASTSALTSCPICKEPHFFSSCPKFTRANPTRRRELVQQHRRCFNCLSGKHAVNECSSKYTCRICQRKHHSMLHVNSTSNAIDEPSELRSNSATVTPAKSHTQYLGAFQSDIHSCHVSAKLPSRAQVLLATAWITVSVDSGRAVTVRALLDQGSEGTFITENLAQSLRAKRIRTSMHISAVGGVHAGTARHATRITVSPQDSRTPSLSTTALVLKSLTSYAPKHQVDIAHFSHIADLKMADFDPTGSAPINIIVGADLYSEILLEGLRKGKIGEPIAQKTIFGWIISGPLSEPSLDHSNISENKSAYRISVNHCFIPHTLEDEIKKFWEVEELPRRTLLSAEDEQCERHFSSTFTRSDEGRYVVRLPFKREPPIEIGDSRARAIKLLSSLWRRLSANSEQFAEYSAFLKEYESLGHMRRIISAEELHTQRVYIPHHPIIRDGSTTTHLRVVFNASSLTSNGSSLNDHLCAGPKLQSDLSAIILKWRQFRYVYIADIAKMYRQIRVDPRDTNYQCILWQNAQHSSPTEYHLRTVTYGMTCAPFLALRVLKQLESDEGSRFPLAAPILRDHIFVDDVLFGDEDPSRLRQTRDQLISLLRQGGFELRKWASNSSSLLNDIDSTDHGLACKAFSPDESIKVLGLGWNPALDVFHFTVNLKPDIPESKRMILSAIAKFFDPLGWVTPVTISAKIFIQQLWREKLGWDDIIHTPLLDRWTRFYSTLKNLNGLQLARWIDTGSDTAHSELHGFADASNLAYAAVVYLRVVSRSGMVTIKLLAGKSKVAPVRPLTVPRLELSAAVLLVKLLEFVRGSLSYENRPCFCWTDSTIVLAWLKQHPSRWKTFVANRVADIQSRIPNAVWRHVSTAENPADCASRGLFGDELKNHPLWWQGPSWLLHPPDMWPHNETCAPPDAPLEEKEISSHCAQAHDIPELMLRWSSWPKAVRVTAYMFRFINRCRRVNRDCQARSPETAPGLALTASECSTSKQFWIKQIQAILFPIEIRALSQGRELPAKNHILSLRPILGKDGLLRVGGRLRNAPMPMETRCPILLAAHPLVTLIVENAHKRALHAGLQLTLSTLRRDFWILRARNLVKAIIHRCVVCTREKAAVPIQLMGDLPAVRVTAPTRCFQHCGLDYAGPVVVRASAGRGITSRKAYIALFVCLASRAIHLELVSDYSAQAFTNAYSRFCSRRGLPHSMYSDNGTTFVGADRELTSAYRAALRDPNFQNSTASDNISWHFLPPSAPHFGGIWEAGVRSVKHHLRRVLGNHTLTFEEFTTLLCKVEACLNSRPIAPLSDTLEDYEALTPGHLLIGSAITATPHPSLLNLNENRLSRWQLVQQLSEQFWRKWQNDYVNTLQQRRKWRSVKNSIQIGQLVLLRNATLPPCKWELGRVTQCHPGNDDLTRVVTVKTASSEYRRPIVKLCVLPVACEPNEKQ